jgi:hypothetical protein
MFSLLIDSCVSLRVFLPLMSEGEAKIHIFFLSSNNNWNAGRIQRSFVLAIEHINSYEHNESGRRQKNSSAFWLGLRRPGMG